jgi:tRNA (adenine37-N6)-methyltransferase
VAQTMTVEPIGVIRSPIRTAEEAPRQGREAGIEGVLEVEERYREACLGLKPGQTVVILYWMHLGERDRLQVHPRGDRSRSLRGVFSTRSPHRPNPIALENVEILSIEGTNIRVRGLDAFDGTPLLDIKCEY